MMMTRHCGYEAIQNRKLWRWIAWSLTLFAMAMEAI